MCVGGGGVCISTRSAKKHRHDDMWLFLHALFRIIYYFLTITFSLTYTVEIIVYSVLFFTVPSLFVDVC